MSDHMWYAIMAFWTFCFLAFLVVAYRGIKKSDDAMELNDIDWDAFFQESCEYLGEREQVLKLHRVTELPKPMSPTWPTARDEAEPFHLDDDSQPLAS